MAQLNTIKIFDTTLRDGEQSPGCSMNLAEKIRLARSLQTLGVDIIEAGFPVASEGDFAAVRAVAAAQPHTQQRGRDRETEKEHERHEHEHR